MFMYKRLIEDGDHHLVIDIYEKSGSLGSGMPYSHAGAADEHITNVSGNEIPDMVTSVSEWINTVPKDTLDKYNIDPAKFNDYKVLPRLLFGQYLNAQFKLLLEQGKAKGINTEVFYNSAVADIKDDPEKEEIWVIPAQGEKAAYDRVIICTGHLWPKKYEGQIPGWFDSPYPPQKIAIKANHAVAVRGSSLTAIDAIRTLGRHNGVFEKNSDGVLTFKVNDDSPDFRIVMHSRNGLLPAVRFHLEDTHLGKDTVLSHEEVEENRAKNEGFLSLDYVFEQNFKKGIQQHDPAFYEKIKDMNMEAFVSHVMNERESADPFELLKAEYDEAERSIKRHQSVYWKEMLAVLSFAMNYPAKYFSAEDMLRLQNTLMPLISVVIAFVPQSSAETLMAMHNAGKLTMIAVGDDSEVKPDDKGGVIYSYTDEHGGSHVNHYETFVDCIGQRHLAYEDIPFKSLVNEGTVSRAKLRFKSAEAGKELLEKGGQPITKDSKGNYYLTVPGVAINDNFQAIDDYNAYNERLYFMAVPFIGGFNPDYSGLDFGEASSLAIVKRLLNLPE